MNLQSRLLEEKQAKMEKQLEVDKLKMAEEQRRSLIEKIFEKISIQIGGGEACP